MGNTAAERIDRLERALMKLAYAPFNTEMEIRELKGEVLAFKNEMALASTAEEVAWLTSRTPLCSRHGRGSDGTAKR